MLKSAVTSLLLGCQTQKLALAFQRSVINACKRQRRHCHNDNRHGSKSKPSGNRSMKKASCGFTEKDADRDTAVEQIIDDISGQLSANNVRTLSEILHRIITLDRVGCTLDQIQKNFDVLKLTEQDVLQRARILKGLGQSKTSVDLLMMVGSKPVEKVGLRLAKREKMTKFLCKVLECSEAQLEVLKEKHKLLKNLYSNREDLEEKVQFLQQYSISSRDLRDVPELLNIKMSALKARIPMLHKLREDGKLFFEKWPLNTIAARTHIFNYRVKQALDNQGEIDGSSLSYASIARCLGVTEKDICDVSINMQSMLPSVAYSKIRYLLDHGLHRHDILNHIYVLKQPMSTLRLAFKKCHESGFARPPINIFLSFLRTGRLPKTSVCLARQRMYLCTLLGVTKSKLPHKESCRPVWSADRLVIKHNYDFLTSKGFGNDDILCCISILAHDNNILQEYYQKLWQRPDVEPFARLDVWKDKKRVLNLLQYVMEKDMNFNSMAFNAYVEFGSEGHAEYDASETETDQSEKENGFDSGWKVKRIQ